MAYAPVIYCDSFMDYATADATDWWTSPGDVTINNATGRGGRGSATVNAIGLVKEFGINYSCWIVSFAVYGLVDNNMTYWLGNIANFVQGAGDGSGRLSAYGGLTSLATRIGAWTHISTRIFKSATVGTVDIWMDETLALHLTGLNTGTSASTLGLVPSGRLISDLIVQASNTGTDLPFGDRAVYSSLVTGAGNYADLTPNGAGTNYECVDDVNPDEDTTYVSSSTATDRDSYALGNLPAGATAVDAVQICYVARKSDAGSRSLTPFVRIGGTDYDGSAANLSTSYKGFYEVLDVSPATSSAWSVAEVNGMEAGVLVG